MTEPQVGDILALTTEYSDETGDFLVEVIGQDTTGFRIEALHEYRPLAPCRGLKSWVDRDFGEWEIERQYRNLSEC